MNKIYSRFKTFQFFLESDSLDSDSGRIQQFMPPVPQCLCFSDEFIVCVDARTPLFLPFFSLQLEGVSLLVIYDSPRVRLTFHQDVWPWFIYSWIPIRTGAERDQSFLSNPFLPDYKVQTGNILRMVLNSISSRCSTSYEAFNHILCSFKLKSSCVFSELCA